MADQVLVATCRVADFDATTGTCSAMYYSAVDSPLPLLSIADGLTIGASCALLLASAWVFRQLKKAVEQIG